jgi:hypothetical protein
MTYKRLSLWSDGHVLIEQGNRETAFFHNVTPASYRRIERLSWHSKWNNTETMVCTDNTGIIFVSIDRR